MVEDNQKEQKKLEKIGRKVVKKIRKKKRIEKFRKFGKKVQKFEKALQPGQRTKQAVQKFAQRKGRVSEFTLGRGSKKNLLSKSPFFQSFQDKIIQKNIEFHKRRFSQNNIVRTKSTAQIAQDNFREKVMKANR